MKIINSAQNTTLKRITSLKTKKGRNLHGTFVAEGIRTISTFLEAGYIPQTIIATQQELKTILSICPDHEVITISSELMKKISSATTPCGILIEFLIPNRPQPHLIGSGIVLAQIQDPGNMGTLIRTCAALNLKTVITIESVDPWSPKVIQASAGTIALVNLFSCSWDEFLTLKQDIPTWALVVSSGKPLTSLKKPKNVLLVVGNEARGIPTEWAQACDLLVTIPMPGGTESLNAAIAGSIALYMAHIQ